MNDSREIQASKWIRLAQEGEGADFQAAVNPDGEYEVWEAERPINRQPSARAQGVVTPRPPLNWPSASYT